jgi:hypothetical protein
LHFPSDNGAYFCDIHDKDAIIDCDHPRTAFRTIRLVGDHIRIPDERKSTIEMEEHCFRVLSALASLTSTERPLTSDIQDALRRFARTERS